MRLLVSVANADEAAAAHAGGADVIDAKDPTSGALGAVSLSAFEQIASTIDGARPVTAALGDASAATAVERAAYDYAARGASLVKIGFEEAAHTARVATLLTAAVRGAQAGGHGAAGVVAVAYAD